MTSWVICIIVQVLVVLTPRINQLNQNLNFLPITIIRAKDYLTDYIETFITCQAVLVFNCGIRPLPVISVKSCGEKIISVLGTAGPSSAQGQNCSISFQELELVKFMHTEIHMPLLFAIKPYL